MSKEKPKVSLIFLNFNGKKFLDMCIPKGEKAQAQYGNCEIIVVDNGSNDGSAEHIRSQYPSVRLVALPKNIYFSAGCNAGAEASSGDLLFFLNNDALLEPGVLTPLVENFIDPTVFAVCPRILRPNQNNIDEGLVRVEFKGGCLFIDNLFSRTLQKSPTHPIEVFYTSGAAMLADRSKFFTLGGFDTLMHPFYSEEVDLCFRAWKKGWRSVYDPRGLAYHLHDQSIGAQNARRYAWVASRKNHYLFIWKNISDPMYLLSHFLQLILPKLVIPNLWEWQALVWALRELPQALEKRRKASTQSISDREIFKRTNVLSQL